MNDLENHGHFEPLRNPLRLLLAGLREKGAWTVVIYGFFGQPNNGHSLFEFIGSTENKFLDGVSALGITLLREAILRTGAKDFEKQHGQRVALIIEWVIPDRVPFSAVVEQMAEQIESHLVDAPTPPNDFGDTEFVQITFGEKGH